MTKLSIIAEAYTAGFDPADMAANDETPGQIANALLAAMPWDPHRDCAPDTRFVRWAIIDRLKPAWEAIQLAKTGGIEAVDAFVNEDLAELAPQAQADALRKTLAPGHDSWDEAAAAAGAYEVSEASAIPRELYYQVYNDAAVAHANALIASLEGLKTYTVTADGIRLGVYRASSALQARDQCAVDAGYSSEADLIEREGKSDLVAKLASEADVNLEEIKKAYFYDHHIVEELAKRAMAQLEQDWDNETTTIVFGDGSRIVMSGSVVEVSA